LGYTLVGLSGGNAMEGCAMMRSLRAGFDLFLRALPIGFGGARVFVGYP